MVEFNLEEVECPSCNGVNPKEVSGGQLNPEVCRCGYFINE